MQNIENTVTILKELTDVRDGYKKCLGLQMYHFNNFIVLLCVNKEIITIDYVRYTI